MVDHSRFSVYNTESRSLELVIPKVPHQISLYACGPTVYSYAHIGNFRSFLTADLIVRTARATGFDVRFVSNITDVGHLSEDDLVDAQGEDKLTRALRSKDGERFENIWDLARYYSNAMLEDWDALNLIEPDVRPRATEHVTEQLELIQQLHQAGYAYETAMGVYFDISKFPQYGRLSGNKLSELVSGARQLVTDAEKRHPLDFALWKKEENHLMRWHSPYGWGFPGWHIECSAMSMKYLGDSFDIHTGGEDNKFPHHECEIAQSEAVSGKRYASYWVHTAHLLVENKKMAKSNGNFYTVRDILKRGVDPLALRYALTSGRYRDSTNFSEQVLNASIRVVEKIRNCYHALLSKGIDTNGELEAAPKEIQAAYLSCFQALRDDLNTPEAYAHVNAGVRTINAKLESLTAAEISGCIKWFSLVNDLLGIVYNSKHPTQPISNRSSDSALEERVADLIATRRKAREEKDFTLADRIRKELLAEGIELVDTKEGTSWNWKK